MHHVETNRPRALEHSENTALKIKFKDSLQKRKDFVIINFRNRIGIERRNLWMNGWLVKNPFQTQTPFT